MKKGPKKRPPRKVLVVEDEAIARHALTQLLASSGYSAQSVGTAEEALDELRHGPLPEIALVDFNLPGMNGLTLTERLREKYPSVFIVMITAAGGTAWRLFDDVQVPYLSKPLNFSTLLEVIDEHGRSEDAKNHHV